MTKQWIVGLAAALTASCVHETRTSVVSAPSAPQTIWDRQIRNASDAGDGDYPLKALRQRVVSEPDNVPARLELSKAYADRGYPELAVEVCRLAVERFPDSAEAQFGLVRSLYAMKRPAEAIAALEAHPRDTAEFHSWLGILRDAGGAWTEGEPSHRKAVALAPARDDLHNNLGYNLLMQKKGEEAAAEFREALRLNPASQVARNNLGLALANTDTQQALASWREASDPATAHSNLAAVWIENGNYAEARKELAVALGYNKSHPAALKNLELVARLDVRAAELTAATSQSRWDRWKKSFRRLFVGPLDANGSAERSASAK